MKATLCVCIGLALVAPQLALAKQKPAGGKANAKAGRAGGGGGGAARLGGGGQHGMGGNKMGGGRNFNGGQARSLNAHSQHGLNARSQHGLNGAHNQHIGHGLNAHQGRLQARHLNNRLGNRFVNNRLRANHLGGHWRSGLRWRNCHALYAGYHRAWHDHWWWHSHYNHVLFVGGNYWGGYWYWDGGYWFPAWGYDPVYVGYVYDGPIFAYANLPPNQVVVNVQEALQDEGYYTGDVDGQLGSKTRDAISTYQRDHGLEVTAAVDEPTVQALGLT